MLLSQLLATTLAATALAACPAETKIDALEYIVNAFNEPDLVKSVALINGMPLAPDCEAFLFINGLPGVSPGTFDATTVKLFSQTVRQVFANVEPRYSAADNNTATLDAIVTLGARNIIPLPITTRIVVTAIFNDNCLITQLPTYITIPTTLLGNPINPPIVPVIPGLERVPGFRQILRALVPAIGNVYNL